MAPTTDLDLTTRDIVELTSSDAIASFLTERHYPTNRRKPLSASALGLTSETADGIRHMELLAEDDEQFLRVIFVQLRSITAKARYELVRNLGNRDGDHLLILTKDFEVLEFVLIDKETRRRHGPGGGPGVRVFPRIVTVIRKASTNLDRRILRRLTWTGKDGLDQFDKLRSVFEAAHYSGMYFQNRALFADHYLETRLREDAAWGDDPSAAFAAIRDLFANARSRFGNKPEQTIRDELYQPVWKLLGFKAKVAKAAKQDHLTPDYELHGADGTPLTVAFCYHWDRWLDGPDLNDPDTPDENPGAAVVSALAEGKARWVIVTNGKYWRLYSRDAHSRSTNFYEVDLEEALLASGETDPNEAFRYWWLFVRRQAFEPCGAGVPAGKAAAGQTPASQETCWLDTIVQGSRDYAKRLGERLKDRVFGVAYKNRPEQGIFAHLAAGLLQDRKKRLGITARPGDDELKDAFEATLTLLYRLLFLLYAESRDLLPVREAAYKAASLKQIKEEIAEKAGIAETDVPTRLSAYSDAETTLYDRLARLFGVMDQGDAVLNVPCYNGGLFLTKPDAGSGEREHRIARFLLEHKVPDRYLALAIDRLARDVDEKTFSLAFIDYKSLEVRHLGSIYEGLLEFKLKIADEDLGVATEKKAEKYIPLSQAKAGRGKKAAATAVVRKGDVYLSNDKAERKATGSYYTPDPIVEYIVEHTVGPVLAEKLETLRADLNAAGKTYHRHIANAKNNPALLPKDADPRAFAASKTYAEHHALVDRVFDMKVLDPAMGSGHFLVEAVDFITDRLLDFLNRFPHNPVQFALDKTRRSILDALGQQGVTVDPDKLPDVNLLKRHVLKRCIYGVDLNPMAVELAKVSLWLDAFTLGAPLSFLDHHLRCGNSLIGESDVREHIFAGSGREEDLCRAIHNMIEIAQMADANPSDVQTSKRLYQEVERLAQPFKNRLSIEVARFFTDMDAVSHASMIKYPFDADFDPVKPREGFGRSHAAYLKVLDVAKERRFFHWEIEFPEVFFDFAELSNPADSQYTKRFQDSAKRMAKPPRGLETQDRKLSHKNDIAAGSAGFDAVVGNPPYVRQEVLKPLKAFLKAHYETYGSTNDLYVYFQEQEVRNLRAAGRMGMIVANKWMRSGYGHELRSFLRRAAQPLELIDFGHAPIFPDADTFPCIPIIARRLATLPADADMPAGETMQACPVPREHWDERMNLEAFVRPRRYPVPTNLLRDDGWSLEDPRVQVLLERIRSGGMPLRGYCGSQPLSGIKTGFNEAFFINAAARERLIHEDRRSTSIIKPLLRGRDMERWASASSDVYLICIPSSENQRWPWSDEGQSAETVFKKAYPAVHKHLRRFEGDLRTRQDQGRFWWEFRSCDYMAAFEHLKIVWQEMAWFTRFSIDRAKHLVLNTAYILESDDAALVAILNSPLAWWFMWRTAQHGKDEVLRLIRAYTESFPIPAISEELRHAISTAAARLAGLMERIHEFNVEAADRLTQLGFEPGDAERLIANLGLSPVDFMRRATHAVADGKSSSALSAAIARLHEGSRPQQIELLGEQLEAEKQIASLVEDAYGLTPEERALLRETRPIRDPLDVLEAKIKGGDLDPVPELNGAEE